MATEQERVSRIRLQRQVLAGAVALLGLVAVLWLAVRLSNVLFMVFVSVFAAVALEPPVHYLAKRGWRRGSATGVVFLVVLVMTIGFVWALAPLFVEQINQMIELVPQWIDAVLVWLVDTFDFDLSQFDLDSAGQDIASGIQSVGSFLVGGIIGLGASIGAFLIFATTVALFSFYMIAELPKLQRTVLQWMPENQQVRALRIWDIAVEKMGGYIYSRLVLAFISATIATIVLTFLDVPFALSLGIWVGVLSQFIPVIGTYLAAVLPAVVALSSEGPATMLWVVVFFVAYQQVENYLFSPRITKRTMEIHPAVSVAAIIIGANLMGGVGVILALPMAGIVQAIISESGKRHDVVLDDEETANGSAPEPTAAD